MQRLEAIRALARAGHVSAAFHMLDKLMLEHPNEASVWAARAYINGRQGDSAAAVADWGKVIALCSNEPHYFYMRGIDLFKSRRYMEAVSDFTKVIQLCDHYKSDYYREPAYFFRAETYLRLRQFDMARSDCAHVSDDTRTWTDSLRCKADILAELDVK